MIINFREFLPQDFDRMLELDRASYPSHVRYSRSQFHELLSDPEILCYTVKNDANHIIGGCILKLKKLVGLLRIISVTVEEPFKNSGVGSLMMENVVRAGEFLRVGKISLQVDSENHYGTALFKKFGFRCVKTLSDYLIAGNEGMEMEREIMAKPPSPLQIKVYSATKPDA